jgi:hypothetical protein
MLARNEGYPLQIKVQKSKKWNQDW